MGEMPGSLQAKLLRVLEDGSMRRVGSVKERRVNVRLLAATNRQLGDEVKAGRFREDLFYRINVLCLEVPPLRERPGDVRLLTRHFLGPQWTIDAEALAALEAYCWPGNVRQLINAIERAKIMADEKEVFLEDFPAEIQTTPLPTRDDLVSDDLASLQRAKIVEVLESENGNKARAARRLGISRRSLYRALERFAIH
jgi:transcriptional regulator with PAS, ATPase and Fis domain